MAKTRSTACMRLILSPAPGGSDAELRVDDNGAEVVASAIQLGDPEPGGSSADRRPFALGAEQIRSPLRYRTSAHIALPLPAIFCAPLRRAEASWQDARYRRI